MNAVPVVAFAFTAGMLASINPCGFAMLPAFLSYQLTEGADSPDRDELARAWRALRLSLLATIGFVTVFLSVGARWSA